MASGFYARDMHTGKYEHTYTYIFDSSVYTTQE